jgi:hypothetical protein
MNNISKTLLLISIFIILFCIFTDKPENQDKIRSELASKGLPTPAFASMKQLQNILKNY